MPALIIGFILTLFASSFFYNTELRSRKKEFHFRAQSLSFSINNDIKDINEKIHYFQNLFKASEHVTSEEFDLFARALSEDALVPGWIWAPSVPNEKAAAFIEDIRREGGG